jgi:hypothetical protein
VAALTKEKVKEVRRLLEQTPLFLHEIAEKAGLHVTTISEIARKNTYNGRGWSQKAKFNHRKIIVRKNRANKLTAENARNVIRDHIRFLIGRKGYSVKEICGKYRISSTLFYHVIHGRVWTVATVNERKLLEHIL